MTRSRGGGRRRPAEDEFTAFYAARGDHLRGTAYLLCGDWHLAEDLTQIAFVKLYRAWAKIERRETMDQYARRVLLRAFLDERRRPWRRERDPYDDAMTASVPDRTAEVHDRILLRRALEALPRGRRAVLVLRFYEGLSVEETAEALGCSTGTVKSQTARGLAAMRNLLPDDYLITHGAIDG